MVRTEGTWEARWDITRCRLRDFIHTQSNKPAGRGITRQSFWQFQAQHALDGTAPSFVE